MNSCLITRQDTSDQGTRGVLTSDRGEWLTLELPWRDNTQQISCIPAGVYACSSEFHARLGRVYRLQRVEGRSGVLIHSGNLAGDVLKGWRSHVQGCILVGKKRGQLWLKDDGRYQEAVLISATAMSELGRAFAWAPIRLEVAWSNPKL